MIKYKNSHLIKENIINEITFSKGDKVNVSLKINLELSGIILDVDKRRIILEDANKKTTSSININLISDIA